MKPVTRETIPDELKEQDQWICWEEKERNGKTTKLPRAPWVGHNGNISATDSANWTGFEAACAWAEKHPSYGLGFVFSADNKFCGVDLDDCVVEHEGEQRLKPSAKDIMQRVDSFTEYSPSGEGLHILVIAELDEVVKNDDRGVEVYDRDRFFTVTGDIHDSSRGMVIENQDGVDWVADEYMTEDDESEQDATGAGSSGDTTPTPSGDTHPLYDLSASDVYPTIGVGENVEHPVHGSTTGHNFKVHASHPTAVCWRGEHQYGSKQGCTLCAWHLLAMEGGTWRNCRTVRKNYTENDEMVFEAWKEAYHRNLVSGEDPPWRAVRYICEEFGLAESLDAGGQSAWATFRSACRIIRSKYDIPVKIDD